MTEVGLGVSPDRKETEVAKILVLLGDLPCVCWTNVVVGKLMRWTSNFGTSYPYLSLCFPQDDTS